MNLSELPIFEAARRYREGSLSPVTLTQHCIERISKEDALLNSFNTVTGEKALEAASSAEAELKAGRDRGLLHGIPYAVKDVIDTAGVLTSCQSRLLADNVPAKDAHVVEKLAEAGAVLLGKTTTYEFATGGPATDALFPPARNPWDVGRLPGGSSSGSAAAVAAGFTRLALGTDTGGSIRGPASLCGTVGLKPTFGRVSRRGIYPLAYSLDHCGVLTWTVEDAAIALTVIAGHDDRDPASARHPVPNYFKALNDDPGDVSLAIAANWFRGEPSANAETTVALEEAASTFKRAGFKVSEIELTHWEEFIPAARIILLAECFAIHQRNLTAHGDLYGRRSRGRLAAGSFVRASDYINAQRVRSQLMTRLNAEALSKYDVLIVPTTMGPAMRPEELTDDPTHIPDVATVPFSLTGNPAISICCGFTREGLPLGMQLVGRYFEEATLLRTAAAYCAAKDWQVRRPTFADQMNG